MIDLPSNTCGESGELLSVLRLVPWILTSSKEIELDAGTAEETYSLSGGESFSLLRCSPSECISLVKSFELSVSAIKASQEHGSLIFCGYRHLSIDHRYKFKKGLMLDKKKVDGGSFIITKINKCKILLFKIINISSLYLNQGHWSPITMRGQLRSNGGDCFRSNYCLKYLSRV
ncbi:MAG: hypothetical protein QHG99_09085 [Methanomicrobiales archaeon]|nr:hypothetical protein [Methanomicrobiales archaeon]